MAPTSRQPAASTEKRSLPHVSTKAASRAGRVLVLAVEADVVIARDRQQRARQVGEHGAGEVAVVGVVGILVDDVAGEGDEVGRVGGDLAEQPAQRRRETGDGGQVRVGELRVTVTGSGRLSRPDGSTRAIVAAYPRSHGNHPDGLDRPGSLHR